MLRRQHSRGKCITAERLISFCGDTVGDIGLDMIVCHLGISSQHDFYLRVCEDCIGVSHRCALRAGRTSHYKKLETFTWRTYWTLRWKTNDGNRIIHVDCVASNLRLQSLCLRCKLFATLSSNSRTNARNGKRNRWSFLPSVFNPGDGLSGTTLDFLSSLRQALRFGERVRSSDVALAIQ